MQHFGKAQEMVQIHIHVELHDIVLHCCKYMCDELHKTVTHYRPLF